MKVCLAASAGGHLTQLIRLLPACRGHDVFIVTTAHRSGLPKDQHVRSYSVPWANRNHPYQMMRMLLAAVRVVGQERPDVLISTGAAVGCVVAVLMKVMRKKVIWIDTISHTEYLTLSGRIVRRFADVFLVQWPELVQLYDGVEYRGSVL